MLIRYIWDGEAMRPMKYFAKKARDGFEVNGVYDLAEVHHRNMNAHGRFFAQLNEVYQSLPEDGPQFPDVEALRKYLLTFTPFCSVEVFEARTLKEAVRVATFLKKDQRFCRVEIDANNKVWQYVPDSQAVAAMPDNRVFRKSCDAVLDAAAQQLGVSVEEINAARSA